jgi:hypothetical protein
MVFSSIEPRARNALLALVSLVFYASGAHALVFMFLASIGVNYLAGLLIAGWKDRGEPARAVWATSPRSRGRASRERRRPGPSFAPAG